MIQVADAGAKTSFLAAKMLYDSRSCRPYTSQSLPSLQQAPFTAFKASLTGTKVVGKHENGFDYIVCFASFASFDDQNALVMRPALPTLEENLW